MARLLHRLNGWRRLWLVATAAAALWFVVLWPLTVRKDHYVTSGYSRDIEKEFASGQCQAYQTAPFDRLKEPKYSEACWHIYTSRQSDSTVPYTLEAYNSNRAAWHRNVYFWALGIGAAGTAIASGLVYFFGWLVGWILMGFRQPRQP